MSTIYSDTHMFDFALHILQNGMAAAYEGKKNIDGLSPEEYIKQELATWEGDED